MLAGGCGRDDTVVGEQFPPDASGDAGVVHCTGDLSGVGAGDFQVSLSVTTQQPGLVALVNQRKECTPSVFWDVRMNSGLLFVEVDDVANYTAIDDAGPTINDGRAHAVTVRRIAGVLSVSVDGVDASAQASLASLDALAPLAIGTDPCVQSTDGTVAFSGTIAAVCVAPL
jgi:hypothetical protein